MWARVFEGLGRSGGAGVGDEEVVVGGNVLITVTTTL